MERVEEVQVGSRRLKLSNLDKVLYPAVGFTKAQVIDYYIRIAPVLLPHLKNHPLTLKRYPNGVDSEYFYEKNCPRHRPAWVKTTPVWSEGNQRDIDFCLANDVATLVWVANLASLELHPSLSLARDVERPTAMVFDLDPGPPAGLLQCCEVALLLRRLFEPLGLESFPKTSGSKGLQLYVPLNTATSYDETKPFSHAVARRLESERPELVVSSMKKVLREGKVLVDWSQNDARKTTVCVYSLRAKARPTVSTPVRWEEVEHALKRRDPDSLVFDSDAVLERVERKGDLFAPVAQLEQRLPRLDAGEGRPARRRSRRVH